MSNKQKRLNEAMRNAELAGGNLGLPQYLIDRACRTLRNASKATLATGRIGWDALAGGAIILHARNECVGRETDTVAQYVTTGHEQVCSGARTLRLGLDMDVPPARRDGPQRSRCGP